MVVRIARILSASVILVLLADGRPAVCEGWSLPNPFSSESKTEPKSKKPVLKTAKKQPSALEKMSTGTKNFFNKTGETLGLKKPEPKKPGYAVAKAPPIQPRKKADSKSWLGSVFQSEEPKKDKTVPEWMDNNKRLDP